MARKAATQKRGAPSKIVKFTEALELVLSDPYNVIACTDEDLVELVNSYLNEGETIKDRTLRNWKNGDLSDKGEEGRVFISSYKKALILQKINLIKNLANDPDKWQKWAWIIERKFDEWNIRTITEASVKHSGTMKTEQHVVDYSKLSDAALEEIIKAGEQKPNE